jgi:hypothetical protein
MPAEMIARIAFWLCIGGSLLIGIGIGQFW